jgi:hypothetical protein
MKSGPHRTLQIAVIALALGAPAAVAAADA